MQEKIIITLEDIKSRAFAKRKQEPLADKIIQLGGFVELLSSKLVNDINNANSKGESSLLFLNFWTIKWEFQEEDGEVEGEKVEVVVFSSNCTSTASARNISTKFAKNGCVIEDKLVDHFYSIITKPPLFMKTLSELSSMAKRNQALTKSTLSSGNEFAYLFHVLFVEIFYATYSGESVQIDGLGKFDKALKTNSSSTTGKTPVGYLQFYPNFN